MSEKVYRTAIYCRLSKDDGDKEESNSIVSQRAICEAYIAKHDDLELVEAFADDGYSGVSFSRPQFERMEQAIREGRINCVICKDLSRFARNYIEAGRYQERIFPKLGIRFIAVNDGYDTLTANPQSDSFIIPFKNLVNDTYCKDISIKIRSKHNLIIDEKGAKIVRRIFEMACDGVSINAIAKRLNEEGVITPAKYFAEKHPGTLQKYSSLGQRWSYASVHCILKRYSYTGALVTNKKATLAVGSNKHRLQDESEWIVIKGRFEPIISEEVFEQAQKILLKKRMVEKQTHDYPLRSLVRCGCCGRLMKRRAKGYGYECKYKKDDAKGECAGISYETENDLENVVFRAIRTQIEIYDVKTADRKALNEQKSKAVKETVAELSALEHQADHVREDKLRQYEEYVAGRISKEAYLKKKADGDTRLANIKEKIAENTSKLSNLGRRVYASDEDDTVAHFRSQEKLTNEMAKAFIEAVYIHEKAAVEIKWRFADCFSETIKNDEMEVDIQ